MSKTVEADDGQGFTRRGDGTCGHATRWRELRLRPRGGGQGDGRLRKQGATRERVGGPHAALDAAGAASA